MPERMSQFRPNEEEEGVDHPASEEGDLSQRKAPSPGARLWDRVRSRLLRPKVNSSSDQRCIRVEPGSPSLYLTSIFPWRL